MSFVAPPAFKDKRVIVVITGSIAIYKMCDLVFALRKADARPAVIMTTSATKMVGTETFRALSGEQVHVAMFDHPTESMPHIALADDADVAIVAPATANFMAKAAHGFADDLASAFVLTATCPIVVAPAMNVEMWAKPPTKRNVAQLAADGLTIVEPVSGHLACRADGQGKMAPIERILEVAAERL